ncbi:PAS domain-containing protein [Aestuariispira insulae]|uniref:PAS domain-containing protein n=1 Tax=Aestuariispira insulae TaxID=1461337 RepID=A0A3D9HYA2_9PROT|nr:PAS domain-containing protein [Aestuariispira insulae]RED54341.1 PAS domain-containing protein [Aestuariispira insulae]
MPQNRQADARQTLSGDLKQEKPFRPPLQEPLIRDESLWETARSLASGDMAACDDLLKKLGSPPPKLIWNPDPDELPHPEFSLLMQWWQETKGDRPAPSPEDVDPLHLVKLLGHLILTDVCDEGENFHVRLYGSQIGKTVEDLTGKDLKTIWTPLRHYFIANYRAICLRPEPLYSLHTPALNINLSAWDRLILPLMEGDKVKRIMIGIFATDRQPLDG